MRKKWTDEEIIKLKWLYLNEGMSLSELYPIFFESYNRTKTSVKSKIKKLKLRHTKGQISEIKSRLNKGEKNGMYGKVGANFGKTKENSERVRIASEKMSITRKKMYKDGIINFSGENNGMYGKEAWNKGKTKYNDDRIASSGEKISKSRKKWWSNLSDNEKNEIIRNLSYYATLSRKDTKIELIVNEVLDNMGVSYTKNQKHNKYVFDFYLHEYNFVIECQGDYWHGNKELFKNLNHIQLKNIKRDEKKIEFLTENGINFLFLWEHEIHRDKKILNDIIWRKLKKIHITH